MACSHGRSRLRAEGGGMDIDSVSWFAIDLVVLLLDWINCLIQTCKVFSLSLLMGPVFLNRLMNS